ncbi:hypothetical protein C1H46_001963 [Malus baccata]|uniref:Uncharacterized protein n=1 Tax=Malus baccata TaxID=106549 RepID=A0A540NP59_MALBA|nr:hypothetical protein C1H46_001963 [Malus baccata]
MDAKDMKIAELTMDLGREEQLCGQYHEPLLTLLNNVEEETELIATKVRGVRGVVNHVREFETDVEGLPQNQMEAKVRGLPPNQTVTEVQGLPQSQSGHN